MTVLVWIFIAH